MGKDTTFFLTNVQSNINKLDMVLYHMEVDKIDIGLITETWINNTIDQDLIASQAKNVGYKSFLMNIFINQNLMLNR